MTRRDNSTNVSIRGAGVAACCCARLLDRPGLRLNVEAVERPKQPAIMLSETTQKLLRDVVGKQDLFDGLPRIRARIVAWSAGAEPLMLPHSAVVVSEQVLLDRIQPQPVDEVVAAGDADWSILAARPLHEVSVERQFGSRIATASPVTLKAAVDPEACWIESCEQGWLFLLPASEGRGWLLSVGDQTESLLAGSGLVAKQLSDAGAIGNKFPCHPRIADPLCGAGWLACGTAALGFDPLCGDGAGHAVREAILASAVVRAAAAGGNVDALVAHYQARLLAGFAKHLQVCQEFYQQGRRGDWWDREIDSVREGLKWCSTRLGGLDGVRYRLNGFALEPVH